MEDVGELLERLGRQIGRMERRSNRAGERFSRRFDFGFGRGHDHDDEDEETVEAEGGEVIERELHFGEQPELRLTANMMSVQILPVGPGEATRVVLKGRDLDAVEVETGTWNDAAAVELRIAHGFRSFRGFAGFGGWGSWGRRVAYIYVPAGTRVRGRADAGSLSVERLQDTELDLRTDAGRLRVEHCSGRLRLRSSAGKLIAKACSGDLDVRADAGKIEVEGFSGRILEGRADAGAIRLSGLRLEPGESTLRTNMGSIDVALVPDVPVHIEAHASLGSVQNRVGEGPRDALVRLNARTDMGSIRIRYDEQPPTPLRSVPVSDEREASAAASTAASSAQPAAQSIPLEREEQPAQPQTASAAPENGTGANETLRILAMLERHEITAAEASALLAALRR